MFRCDVVPRPGGTPMHDRLGEGPVWSAAEGALWWCDIPAGRAHRYDPLSGELRVWTFEAACASVIPRAGGGHITALVDGLYTFEAASGRLDAFARPDGDFGNRSNEVRCDPQGRIWLGTMQNNLAPEGLSSRPITRSTGGLWCVDGKGGAVKLLSDIGISNTLCWSPDGRRFYFADTLRSVIWSFAYDPDGPAIGDRRVFVEGGPGGPDGSAMDEDGCLWTARWGAGRVIRYTPDGRVDREIELPAAQPSSCAFGGRDRRTLYVTSARGDLERPGELDGSLFAVEVDVAGLPMAPFAG